MEPSCSIAVEDVRRHRAAARNPDNLVLCRATGRGFDYREAARAFRRPVKRTGLTQEGRRLSLHSLCHSFASLLIAKRLNVVYVSRQFGHANPNITLGVYAHLFEQADQAAAARDALEASHAAMANSTAP